MHRAIAFGCIAISATLAGLYGYMSADTVFYGAIRAASLCAVAVVGACCPAWASSHWHGRRYGQCMITWAVCFVCLAVTLGGGVGTIAGGAEQSTAERAKVANTAKDDRAELARVTADIAKLPAHRPAGTVTADLVTARAGRAYQVSNSCAPEQISGKAVRDACEAFRKLEGELEAAKEAARLEGRAGALKSSLANGPAVQHANPQAAAIAGLTGLAVDDAVNWYAFVASLALELAGMAAMMRAEAAPAAIERPPPAAPAIAALQETSQSNVVALIQPPKTGTVERFMLACVGRAKGSSVSWAELYVRYRRWCSEESLAAMSAELFGKRLDAMRAEGVVRSRAKGDEVYCLDVRLVA